MRQIEIFSTQRCPYCVRAKTLLEAKGLEYSEIDVSADQKDLHDMIRRSGQRSVPQIFINGELVGGFEQLARLDTQGVLDETVE